MRCFNTMIETVEPQEAERNEGGVQQFLDICQPASWDLVSCPRCGGEVTALGSQQRCLRCRSTWCEGCAS